MSITTSTRLSVRPLHPALGAEVRGLDMRQPLDEMAATAVETIIQRIENKSTDTSHRRLLFISNR